MRLAGKVVMITGGVGGLGAAIVKRVAEEGAIPIVADLDAAAAERFALSHGGLGLALDVTQESQWSAALALIEQRFSRLDALVNNAGINQSQGGETPEDVLLDDLRRMFSVNVEGVVLGCKRAIGLIARGGGGAIVNMSSIAGLLPSDFIAAYGASKAAVAHWTKSTALHCARKGYNVRCNSVHPGSVLTPMMDALFERMAATSGTTPMQAKAGLEAQIPMGRYQEPIDIANAVVFLVSDESRFVTGLELVVDGGMTLAL